MKIELTTDRASLRQIHRAGEVIDVSVREAQALISSGQAVPVREEVVERAVREVPERTVKRGRGRPRRSRAGAPA